MRGILDLEMLLAVRPEITSHPISMHNAAKSKREDPNRSKSLAPKKK